MSAWDLYDSRIEVHGYTKRDASFNMAVRRINNRVPDNLSYTTIEVYPSEYGFNIDSVESQENKIVQNLAVINTDNLDEKFVVTMPGDDIELGALIHWMDNYWLVAERDANTTIYTKAKILQCNHILKWINPNREIIQQWCIVEDGTKYLTGEMEDRNFVVTRGDSRISVQLSRNKHSVALDRDQRFLIDDPETPHKLSYLLTKPLKVGITYNQHGVMKFVMQEVTATEDDNHELGLADYYKFFPRDTDSSDVPSDTPSGNKKESWF